MADDHDSHPPGVVTTIAAKCRRCYNCVRSCPAKAIRVQAGQAMVMPERCIGCGNCLRVCAQQAKQVQDALPAVEEMLAAEVPVVAMLAPSYPAAFPHLSHGQVVAAVRRLGFSRVLEVAFGAEMVAAEYHRLLQRHGEGLLISTPCPALVSYVEKFLPALLPRLVPVVSPMVALGRAVKAELAPGARTVFIGPCIAKKAELSEPCAAGAVDAVMTFIELEELLARHGLVAENLEPSAMDEPLPHLGVLFPVPGGLLKTAAIETDLMDDSLVIVEGPERCTAALHALAAGQFSARFVDALLCEGCIAGPGFHQDLPVLARKQILTSHVRKQHANPRTVARALRTVSSVDLSRGFTNRALTFLAPTEKELRDILARTNKLSPEQELNCGACGYPTCRDKALAVYQGRAEPEMCLPYLIEQLETNLEKLSRSKGEIEKAREIAQRATQLASMGQVAADIASEISRPLGNIAAYAEMVRDSLGEGDTRREDAAAILAEALACREVMDSLQWFARRREPHWETTRLPDLLRRASDQVAPKLGSAGVSLHTRVRSELPPLLADPAQITQVLVNLLNNAAEASSPGSEILLEAGLSDDRSALELTLTDHGRGISADVLPRLFQPFVTTKDRRLGAGLGLAVAHGIIQSHGGEIALQSEVGRGTTVSLRLPLQSAPPAPREAVKVLVVDDDPDFLEQHRLVLEAAGFEVVSAERSDEALEVANREIPDAFVLDLMMERSDSGARLARALRRDPRFRTAPLIILTSVVQETGFEFSRNPREVLDWMKADAWFDKPAPAPELVATIRRLLPAAPATPPADNAAPPQVNPDA